MQRADVRMIQSRYHSSFALETLRELRLRRLYRHDAVEPRISSLPYLAHAARADVRKYFVRAEFVAYRQPHLFDLR
jgi:hypothetical protein